MIYWSAFVRALTDAKGKISPHKWERIREAGVARYVERLRDKRADGPLLFDDLVERIVKAEMV